MKKFVLMMLPLLLTACGGGGNKEADGKNAAGETTKAKPQLVTTTKYQEGKTSVLLAGDLNYDNTMWIVEEDTIEGVGGRLQATILSDNYYVIDNKYIVMEYTFQAVPAAKNIPDKISGLMSCSLGLVNLTANGEANDVPKLKTTGDANKEVSFHWKGGPTTTINMTEVAPVCLMWYYPVSCQFQKDLNKYEGVTTTITIENGENLTFTLDTSKRDKIKVEAIE